MQNSVNQTVKTEDNHELKRYFSKNEKYADRIKEQIQNHLLTVLRERPQKIKTVKGYRYLGKTIFEYKIVLDGVFACRVSFIHQEENILVFYLSNTIRKQDYVRLISKVHGVITT